ncbi:hypothetical protein AZKH_4589 [Azoarcus sp. KH32C]|nr:hypothetical protein AZKH_4589 [Azoarcus sp. KH32C]
MADTLAFRIQRLLQTQRSPVAAAHQDGANIPPLEMQFELGTPFRYLPLRYDDSPGLYEFVKKHTHDNNLASGGPFSPESEHF